MSESSSSRLNDTPVKPAPRTNRMRVTHAGWRLTALTSAFALAVVLLATYVVPSLREFPDLELWRERIITYLVIVLGTEVARSVWVWLTPYLRRFGRFLHAKGAAVLLWVLDAAEKQAPDSPRQEEQEPHPVPEDEVPEQEVQPKLAKIADPGDDQEGDGAQQEPVAR